MSATPEFREAARRLCELVLEGESHWAVLFQILDHASFDRLKEDVLPLVEQDEAYGMYAEGDETTPFVSEAFLYNLIGKEEARTVRGMLRRLFVAGGMTEDEAALML